jgi:FtsP/CotA-like multicopper oxidase with cupredoxin domain
MGGVVAGAGLWSKSASAQSAPPRQPTGVLTGTEFDLNLGETLVDFTGSPRIAHTVNGSLPAPLLRWKEGDTITLASRDSASTESGQAKPTPTAST